MCISFYLLCITGVQAIYTSVRIHEPKSLKKERHFVCVFEFTWTSSESSFLGFRKDSPKALEAYLHALQLLTTVDEGLQDLGETRICSHNL